VITHQFIVYYARFIFVNYVSEYQLLHAVNASHTTPIAYIY